MPTRIQDAIGDVPFEMKEGGGGLQLTCARPILGKISLWSRIHPAIPFGEKELPCNFGHMTTIIIVTDDSTKKPLSFSCENEKEATVLQNLRARVAAKVGMTPLECKMFVELSSGNLRELRTVRDDLMHLSATNKIHVRRFPIETSYQSDSFEIPEEEFSVNAASRPLGNGATAIVTLATVRGLSVAAKSLFAFDDQSFDYSHAWVKRLAEDVDGELERIRTVPSHPSIAAPIGVVRTTFQREGEAAITKIPKYVLKSVKDRCRSRSTDQLSRSPWRMQHASSRKLPMPLLTLTCTTLFTAM